MVKILVVDDSVFICDAIKNILKPENLEVITVQTGAECIERVKNKKIDLILLDIVLPDIDGYEVCRWLKANKRTEEIPVIFITGMASVQDVVKGFETGAVDYINKPFNSFELRARVFAHLRNKIMSDELKRLNMSLQEALDENEKLLREDSLTKLYNRRYTSEFLDFMQEPLNEEASTYVIMLDIDDFKKINDTYGHMCGDYVICAIASILKDKTGEKGIVSRWGGEEFLISIKESSEGEALDLAQEICDTVRITVFYFERYKINCSITAGVSAVNRSRPVEKSIAQADEALYIGKQNGKNQVNLYREQMV